MYDKLNALDKMIYDTMIIKCNECKGYEMCKQDLIGMKPVVVLENEEYVLRSVECGKRYGLISGKYKNVILSAPELYTSKIKLFNLLVNKENGFIRGGAGHGKTTLMLNIAKHFYKQGYNVMYDLAVNISIDLKDFEDKEENTAKKMRKYQDVDYLFIDDFAREKMTLYKIMDIFNPIIQHRIDNNLPTYLNSNYSLDELSKMIESKVDKISADAFCDRIRFNLGLFKLHDKNYRMENVR